ncbi:MAG: hypothetical protein V2J42_00065 [Wenzhouxiangella sp.]|jgi:hypothetical protein|nr:hypothetical protein [Wenzhouxiangella sp.]
MRANLKSLKLSVYALSRFVFGRSLVALVIGAGLGSAWACTVFTDRFDDQTVDGRFVNCYDVTASSGPNGSISPTLAVLVPEGSLLTFLLNPESGYQIDQVSGCDGMIENDTDYVTGPVIADCEVSATFTNLGECSLWNQNCPVNEGCYLVSGDGTTSCAATLGRETGESCGSPNECAPGLICAGAPGSATCRPLCNTNGSVVCQTGECTSIGISNIGACF